MTGLVGAAVVELLVAVALVVLGAWGRRRVARLVPLHLPAEEREVRADSMALGCRAAQGIGMVLAAFSVVTIATAFLGAEPTLRPQ